MFGSGIKGFFAKLGKKSTPRFCKHPGIFNFQLKTCCMKTAVFALAGLLALAGCQTETPRTDSKKNRPSHQYAFVDLAPEAVNYLETDYVPVYSDIYHMDGTKRFLLTTTLSIRNTSLNDSVYLFRARYNDSYGQELRQYIDKTILLKPLESIEFVVEYSEDEGGAGASFLIDWGADKNANQLLIQAVMTGTSNQQGLSFLTEAKVVKRRVVSNE